jgi:TonB family protein
MNVLVLLSLLSTSGQAPRLLPQPAHDTTFYDGNWRHVGRANAVYYGLVTPLDSGRCRIQDFYLSGERQMEASGRFGPPVVKDGPVTYYFRSGAKRTTGQFANGKRAGVWLYWNEDGSVRQKKKFVGNTEMRFTIDAPNADSKVLLLVEQMPVFPGRVPVVQYLANTIRRPAGAPPVHGDGKVFVQFVVGPEGSISSARIIKSFDSAYDAEVLRAVVELPRWKPGRQNGEPVAVQFVVPVVFH